MALNPDAVRYLKAVLTAEAMVKELDPQFDLRSYENRFFGRLMELEAIEALDPRRLGQRMLDARVRLERVLDAIESIRETPRDLLGVALNVRRRVQFLSALTIVGWVAVLVGAVWSTAGRAGLRLFGLPADGHRARRRRSSALACWGSRFSKCVGCRRRPRSAICPSIPAGCPEMTSDPNPRQPGPDDSWESPPATPGAGSESDAAPRRRLVEFLFEHSARPYQIGPDGQRRARQRDEGALCGEIRLPQQSIGRIEEIGLHHRSARQSSHYSRQFRGGSSVAFRPRVGPSSHA